MSNIYIQEPPTDGKVLLVTSVGDIDVELWSKEAPKACRNFVQLCMEGYYDGTIFHRLVKGFIVQGGDPTGTGTGGESIYGSPFKDEFHSRLRFNRRGLLAMANAGKDDNASQFFFTLAATPELQNKHTIFAKVTGATLYNMLKLEEGLIDDDERPTYPQKIIKTEILSNPFTDITPRILTKPKTTKEKKKEKKSGVKNFKLLSFGDEAEEDEEEVTAVSKHFADKSKSMHDLVDDPKLSSVAAVDVADHSEQSESDTEKEVSDSNKKSLRAEKVAEKLKRRFDGSTGKEKISNEDDEDYYFGKDRDEEKKRKVEEIKKEIDSLKKDYHKGKHSEKQTEATAAKKPKTDEAVKEYLAEQEKYKNLEKSIPKKGQARENFTLELLAKFSKKLEAAKEKAEETEETVDNEEEGSDWLAHKLVFDQTTPVLAKDANTKDDEWFDITDPRHAINKSRREASKKLMKSKEKRTF